MGLRMRLTFSRPRVKLLLFFAVSLALVLITTNIIVGMRNVVSQERLGKILQNELQNMLVKQPSIQDQEKQIGLHDEIDKPSRMTKLELQYQEAGDYVPSLFFKNFTPRLIWGRGRDKVASFVIGIPSVRRQEVGYLHKTLHSVLKNIYPAKEDEVAVIVFLAERDDGFVKSEAEKITQTFTREINNGLLQVIAPPENIYPSFDSVALRYSGETHARVQWRAKEVFDAAFLMNYCRNKASYYLMLEDDLLAARGFVTAMEEFSKMKKDMKYAYLSFSLFNSVGKLFRSEDIPVWVTYLFTFFDVKPIDWLMDDFLHIMACNPEISPKSCENRKKALKPSPELTLFQHIGTRSSLAGKTVNLVDPRFSPISSYPNTYRNPSAEVEASFSGIDRSSLLSWYSDGGGMKHQLSLVGGKVDDYIAIKLLEPRTVSRIYVRSGQSDETDNGMSFLGLLQSALIEVEQSTAPSYKRCAVFDRNGEAECRMPRRPISKIRIRLTAAPSRIHLALIFVK